MTTSPALMNALGRAMATKRCTLIVGERLAEHVDGPTRASVLAAVSKRAGLGIKGSRAQFGSLAFLETLSELIFAEGANDLIPEEIYTQQAHAVKPHSWISNLLSLPFSSIISLNWDDVVERHMTTPFQSYALGSEGLPSEGVGPVVYRPLGGVNSDEWYPSVSRYRRKHANSLQDEMISQCLATNSLIFVGSSSSQILDLLDSYLTSSEEATSPKFSILSSREIDQITTMLIETRYRLEIDRVEDAGWEERLTQVVSSLRSHSGNGVWHGQAAKLQHLSLRNIGPFTELSLPLSQHWTAILGDNGSGKTSILRALALALAGTDISPRAGAGLLREGARDGEIAVTLGESTYRTSLFRSHDSVRAEAKRATPIQTGGAIALGFPAIRGVVLGHPSGPEDLRRNVGAADLRPLAEGEVDTRVGEFQQWLVNLALSVTSDFPKGSAELSAAKLDMVFQVWNQITPGIDLEFVGVDGSTWDVLVRSSGVVHPLRNLSQGTLGGAAWLGMLIKSISETLESRGENFGHQALSGAGVVLIIDEIDAHLHPAWQKALVSAMRSAFPELQVVLSTHSPLIAGGLEPGEVQVIERTPEGGGLVRSTGWLQGLRADQILTSEAFALKGTRDVVTEGLLNQYEAALAQEESPEARARVTALEQALDVRLPHPAESLRELRDDGAARGVAPFGWDELSSETRQRFLNATEKWLRGSVRD